MYYDIFKNYLFVILGYEFLGRVVEVGKVVKGVVLDDFFFVLGVVVVICG